jgi:phenylalanyl-tRNA synthetase beta chain
MKFTFFALKEYLQTTASAQEICEKLTAIGLEVESFQDKARDLAEFTVAKVIDAKPHENSTKLKICQVETIDSKTPLQIICGASNARAGIKVAYAKIGCVIPANGMVIKKAKIAGTESNGMLCSTSELGLVGDDSGIIEIDDKWQVGDKVTDVFGINDKLIEINVTPNRGDCLGVFGIARDLAASGIGTLKNPEITQTPSQFPFPLKVENHEDKSCTYAAFRQIKNIKNCQSPKWLKDKLEAVGMNSISAIVDITNYVMHSLNRPMHAYDASKVEGEINIRFAKKDEKFTSLKNEEYLLDEKILVISDAKKIIGIGGVMGSLESSCNLQTTEIILEAAFFTPVTVSYSGRKLNILSDSRHRSERGIDEASCVSGIDLATKLILEICGGNVSEIKIVGKKSDLKTIKFDFSKIKKLIGIEVSQTEARKILTDLGFIIDSNFNVTIPSHRHDISISEDLVEEIVRIFGYDKITPKKLNTDNCQSSYSNSNLNKARSYLASQGMIETISWSFVDSKLIEIFAEKIENLTLANPISSEMDHMRPNLAIGLIESYKKNYLRNTQNLSLFEIGNVFTKDGQKQMISGIRSGKNQEQDHYQTQRDFDVFDVKKDLAGLVENLGLRFENLQIDSANPLKYYHPHRFAALRLGKNLVGYFGEIHPAIVKKFDLKNRINIFEIFVDALPNTQKTNRKAFLSNDFPIVERDFAFLVNQDLAAFDLIKTISNTDKQLIKEVDIFDIFSGKNVEEGKKSIALRVKIQAEKTLTSEEIESLSKKIVEQISQKYQATLRNS